MNERGQISIAACGLLVLLVLAGALIGYLGGIDQSRASVQRAADLAALSAGRVLADDPSVSVTELREAAAETADENGARLVDVRTLGGALPEAVRCAWLPLPRGRPARSRPGHGPLCPIRQRFPAPGFGRSTCMVRAVGQPSSPPRQRRSGGRTCGVARAVRREASTAAAWWTTRSRPRGCRFRGARLPRRCGRWRSRSRRQTSSRATWCFSERRPERRTT